MQAKGLIGQYAGFVTRAAGLIVDILIIIVIIFVANVAIVLPLQFFLSLDLNRCPAINPGNAMFSWALICHAANYLRLLVTTLTTPVYFALFWNLSGQTIGQYAMGVRVVRVDGKKMTFLRALVRFAGYLLSFLALGLGFLWVLIDDRRQGLADKMAKTVVLYSWEARQNEFLLDRMKRLFKRGKLAAQPQPQRPAPIPAPILKDLKLILVVFENYELLRKVLNLLQDAIRTGLVTITNVTVLVKDEGGEISIVGVSDLTTGDAEISMMPGADSRLPELEIEKIRDGIPNNSFAVAVVLEEKWASRALRVLLPLGLDVHRYTLGDSEKPMAEDTMDTAPASQSASANGAGGGAEPTPAPPIPVVAEAPVLSAASASAQVDAEVAYAADI